MFYKIAKILTQLIKNKNNVKINMNYSIHKAFNDLLIFMLINSYVFKFS